MQVPNGVSDCWKFLHAGFDHKQPFMAGFHFTLPAIDGFDARDDIDAGGQPLLDQVARDLAGFVVGRGGGQDDSFVGHMKFSGQLAAIRPRLSVTKLVPTAVAGKLPIDPRGEGEVYWKAAAGRSEPGREKLSTVAKHSIFE